ncbi:LysR family transcriptional regulator [Mycobacterium bourgelatii]|uniref:Probable hydrogen peroxide-inducible genes activator n=1 Tax=Mycobacterium bourgelatii TaxID=1273442 RepID=A0A7I9YZI0_MYCBU|nr:LysR family transcriptional regulator [Mycobacterium bourgelatii]MCV6976527.1 LysR family transcriptional regulator [Mycobacterium bourgelatii]GFG93976.1 LysR family transcriptional regulator [Mycobacterium bourgelatii]
MLFRQLEYFVAVAQERHFARAAERCYVSQPALSSAIAKLERELNVTLINRGHSFEGLTPEGERLVVWAKRILAEHDAFKAEVAAVRSGITGTLRLGTVPTASTTASLVLSAFCSEHPLVKVQISSRLATTELYRRLREFELDAVIVHPASEGVHDVDSVPLYEEHFVLLARADMLSPGATTLTWPEAAQLPLALLTPDMRDRQIVDAAFAEHGITVSPQVETDSVASLFAQAAAGDWACIVPHTWLWMTPMAGARSGEIRAVQLVDPVLKATIALVTNAGGPGSPVARALKASAQGLALNEFFDGQLHGITQRR